MPDPTYQNDLVLFSVFFKHDALTRLAEITGAFNDNTVNASAQDWADLIQAVFVDNFKAQIDTAAVIQKTTTLKGDGSSTFTVGESTAAPTRGLNSMSSTPPNCAILLRKITAVGGRKNRGRTYLPFSINESEVDEAGNLSGSVQTDVNNDAAGFITDIEGGGDAEFVIANREYDAPWDNPNRKLVAVTIGEHITSWVAQPVIATQRRRMPR